MTVIRVGMNKILGILSLCVAGLNLITFTITGAGMQAALGAIFTLLGLMQLLGPALVIELADSGSGEVLVKNPFGMTLRRHAFASLRDIQVDGSKLHVTRTDGDRKKLGGFGVDGSDMRRLAATLDQRRSAT